MKACLKDTVQCLYADKIDRSANIVCGVNLTLASSSSFFLRLCCSSPVFKTYTEPLFVCLFVEGHRPALNALSTKPWGNVDLHLNQSRIRLHVLYCIDKSCCLHTTHSHTDFSSLIYYIIEKKELVIYVSAYRNSKLIIKYYLTRKKLIKGNA